MILPGTYANGFAPRDGQPLYPSLWKGCVGAWNPGLGPSGLVLRDNSGFGNNGTLTNGPTFAASGGRYAINFDGTDDYVVVLHSLPFASLSVASTFSAWVYFNAVSSYQDIISKPDFNALEWRLTNGGKIQVYTGAGNALGTTAINAKTWYNLQLEFKTGASVGRVNGAVDFTGAFTMTDNGQDFNFGRRKTYTDFVLDGFIDDVRIYNRALSPQEIRTLATRRGIAYEMAPRRRSSAQVTVAPLRYNLFSGSIGNTDVIGAS